MISDGDFRLSRAASANGADAANWMRVWGATCTYVAETFVCSADWLAVADLELTRIAHSPVTFAFDRVESEAVFNPVMLLMVVQGSLEVLADGVWWTVDSGNLLLLSMAQSRTITSVSEVVYFCFRLSWPRLMLPGQVFTELPLVSEVDKYYSDHVISLCNAVLNGRPQIDQPGLISVRRAVEATVSALIIQSITLTKPLSSINSSHTIAKARKLIEMNLTNPDYTTANIAADLNISRATLERIFARESRTPAQELRAARASMALNIVGDRLDNKALPLSVVASRSGYRNVRALTRALRNHEEHQQFGKTQIT